MMWVTSLVITVNFTMPIERKLAAIMFTDIAGYTALSARDSKKTSELLKTQRETLKPIVEKHGGSWMKEMGDGLLLTFDSATSAVECSIAIKSYLESAYNQVQENASKMDDGKTFLSYPLPTAIIEEYNKVKKDKN